MDIRNNSLLYLKKKYINELADFYEDEEARHLINYLIREFFGFSRTDLAINPLIRLSESEILRLHFAVKDLKNQKPIQYIIGKSEFAGLLFQVNESVLIPRPETEELVQLIVSKEKQKNLHILDIGTGSGCIAVSLENKLDKPFVTAIDIDNDALKIAAFNASTNNSIIKFISLDILDENSWARLDKYDVIVSNPPYVTESDKYEMSQNVLNFEPHRALFVSIDDELIFYRKIFQFADIHLKHEGRIYFEVNEKKASDIKLLLNASGFNNIVIKEDFRGKPRFLAAKKT